MTTKPLTFPTFAAELLAARAALRLPDEIGLAIRADRSRLRLSQRAYAARRSLTAATVARLETRAGDLKLSDVIRALESTPFVLRLCHRPEDADDAAASANAGVRDGATPVPVTYWPRTELVVRVRTGNRRFPAHRRTRQVDHPPLWWWNAEGTDAFAKEPNWYAPRPIPWLDEQAS